MTRRIMRRGKGKENDKKTRVTDFSIRLFERRKNYENDEKEKRKNEKQKTKKRGYGILTEDTHPTHPPPVQLGRPHVAW
ncbi:hypothetical protein E2C01_086938 [Portunus trituberculatus]|uniref:Uncharacterized protein n=1 Tax=Portunus trituberculatus TaxID=210409 RepID=A0A5B7JCQ8_PORTR|nr:hypothetical protein [Portunus trituberculatus]